MNEHLPKLEKLTRNANTFKCESCSAVIGKQADKSGEVKAESITTYYRLKLEDPIQFVFICGKCAEPHL